MIELSRLQLPLLVLFSVLVSACEPVEEAGTDDDFSVPVRISEHRGDDDLVTGGLGLDGLTGPAPEPGDPAAPAASELRKLAIHTNWTALAPLSPAGGLGGLIDELPNVPGREFHAFLTLPGAAHPFRVLVQLPDRFNTDQPCLVVAPASGSRGVYGAIAMVAPRALPAGCAVAYTDKGAGTDYFDYADHTGTGLSGQRTPVGSEPLGFDPGSVDEPSHAVGMPHAHSGDHPEADWGRHVLAAAEFGLEVLDVALEDSFDGARTRILAAGLSNGGNAVLRAGEIDHDGLLDGIVALMPNITPPGAPHLFDYTTLAALYQPCMLADLEFTSDLVLGNPALAAAGELRCASLARAGLLESADPQEAAERLKDFGFDEPSLSLSAVNVSLGFWRSVAVSYASAYLRRDAFDMPCGYRIEAADASEAQRQAWWGSQSGIAPGGGIEIVDTLEKGQDAAFPGLLCLRELFEEESGRGQALRESIDQTIASGQLPDIPVLVIHGRHDGLIPVAFSSRPYVELAREQGSDIAYWEIERGQHFDAVLAAPGAAGRLAPVLPYAWNGIDLVSAVLAGERELGSDRHFEPQPAPAGQPLRERDLDLD